MNLAKYIALGIVSGIFNMYPISYYNHIMIYQNLFNTEIFYDTMTIDFMNIALVLTIIFIYSKDIINFFRKVIINLFKKKKIKKEHSYKKKILCIFLTTMFNTIIYFIIRIKINNFKHLGFCYVMTAIILLFVRSNNYDGDREISYGDAIIIGLSSLVILIPSNTVLLGNLLACSCLKLKKKTSLRYSLTCQLPILLIESWSSIVYLVNDTTYLFQTMIATIISMFVSYEIYKSLKYMYYTNKLYRLALYTLLFAIFIFYWFN